MKGTSRRLRVLRAERDLTQRQLARLAGLQVTRYWHIENGEGLPPTADERLDIAKALDVKVNAIAWPAFDEKARASA